MHPEAKSTTRSGKLNTSKNFSQKSLDPLDTPVQFVKGVGPKLSSVFKKHNIATVRELLSFFPREYEDRHRLFKIHELKEGVNATAQIRVLSKRKIPLRGRPQGMLEARCSDGSGTLHLKWFYAPPGLESKLTVGTELQVHGTVKFFMNHPEIIHPEISWGDHSHASNSGRIVPIYTEIDGIPTRTLRKILWEVIEKYNAHWKDDLPQSFLQAHQLPSQAQAIKEIHFPTQMDSKFKSRLIYDEFFKFEYAVLRRRLNLEKENATPFKNESGMTALKDLIQTLPFQLTQDQKQSVKDILEDLAKPHPMNRMVQGDVGSGKTAVAFLTVGLVLAEGGQCALMAPTEILAEQHFKNASKLFNGKLNAALLTGSTPQSERNRIQDRLTRGEPLLLIGTHALIEDPVAFKNLSYILIDEQHRFGVEQRKKLREKGDVPHVLILTATPIPRTLALTAYGDLAISTITELPPGRSPIETHIISAKDRPTAFEKIRTQLRQGFQAYFIYPLIEASEAEGFTHLKSALIEQERLSKEVFPEYKVGLLHGGLKAEEKRSVMECFSKNETQVLVSTTVVEVGVDVPNATVMAIEHAERFGLSQLHQLRGRVGRGNHPSSCFLFTNSFAGLATNPPKPITPLRRLEVLEKTSNGFEIAEADLELRGPGEFLGTRQSGDLPFKIANLVRDREWLLKARVDVESLLQKDPDLGLPENAPLRRFFFKEGANQIERFKTA